MQAELQVKTGSPIIGPAHVSPHIPASFTQAPLQRTAMSRHHARRSGHAIVQRPPSASVVNQPHETILPAHSPIGQPTPSSHASSPTALSMKSPGPMVQGGITPPTSAVVAQGQMQQFRSSQQARPQYTMQAQRPLPSVQYQNSNGMSKKPKTGPQAGGVSSGSTSAASAYYSSPFQKHIDQLGKLSLFLCYAIELCHPRLIP